MKSNILTKVENTIEKYKMAQKSEHLLVGLSGGADSVALLLCLYKLGYNVSACHVNHHLRGEESDGDQKFCESLCNSLGIEIVVKHIDVKGYCTKHSVSDEEGARILRYQALESIDADKICTAHNLNDCLETTVFNLARGSGLKGICSIPPVRGKIIRPVIECTRAEIEEFLDENGQDFVTDSTNLEDEFSRNKIRHLVIPQLEKINPSLFKTYGKTVEYLRSDSEYLEKEAQRHFEKSFDGGKFDVKYILGLDFSLRRRVIMKMIEKYDITLSADKTEEIENFMEKGGKLNVRKNFYAVSDGCFIRFEEEELKKWEIFEPVKINSEGEYFYGKRKILFKIVKNLGEIQNVHKKFANCCLDYDKIKGEIVLRSRVEGEKIRLVNRSFNSDVRKLINKAFPLEERRGAIILADSEGAVFVEKYGAADRVKIDSETKYILTFEIS